jgi:hypothetical protein
MSAFKLRSQSSLPAGPSTSATPTATMAKVAATEVDQRLKTINPEQYAKQLQGVQDTMLNRMAGGKYTSVQQMLNEPYQLSKITGPAKLHPYGSVANTPTPDAGFMSDWQKALQDRARDDVTGGGRNYLNPRSAIKATSTHGAMRLWGKGAATASAT